MAEEHDGSIYFGTLDGHIYVFTSEEEAIERFVFHLSVFQDVPGASMNKVGETGMKFAGYQKITNSLVGGAVKQRI